VTGEKRSPSIPELPTMSEAALPGYSAAAWFGLLGPAGMPPAAVTALSNAALGSLQTQEVKDRLFASGVEVRPMQADEFARLIDSEIKKWAQVVKASGARAD
jgi:tripartite-type tricarboxylate transporter receptor subunit TctC